MNNPKNCLICNTNAHLLMKDFIMNKYNINYYVCTNCKCIFTEEPYWLNEAYSDSILASDTGIMVRNLSNCDNLMLIFNHKFNSNIKVVDYGAGYGILTRMLRDKGVDALWHDKFAENLLSRGFEYNGTDKVDVIVAFEVVEHLPNPLEVIKEIMSKTDCFIFSTFLLEKMEHITNKDWWYFGSETGQHIFFSSIITMYKIAEILNCQYLNLNGLHILHRLPQFSDEVDNNILIQKLNKLNSFVLYDNKFYSRTWDDYLFMTNKK